MSSVASSTYPAASSAAHDAPKKTAPQQVRDLYENHVGVFQPYWDAMDREKRFLDGER